MKSSEYLDALKARLDLPSDYALAKVLGVSRGRLSNYRTGGSDFDADLIPKVAELLDLDPASVLADIAAARAKTPFERDAFARLATLARAATVAATAATVVASVTSVSVASPEISMNTDSYTCRTLTALLEELGDNSKKRRRRTQTAGNDGKSQGDKRWFPMSGDRTFRRTVRRDSKFSDTSTTVRANRRQCDLHSAMA